MPLLTRPPWLLSWTAFCLPIFIRDLLTLCASGLEHGFAHGLVAAPEGTLPEALIFGWISVSFLTMLLLVTPKNVAIFGLVMTVEGFAQEEVSHPGLLWPGLASPRLASPRLA